MTRQAIVTRYVGPTNHRGSRIIAKAYAKKITTSYECAWNVEKNHDYAAEILARHMGWDGAWVSGSMPDNTGNVYVWIGDTANEPMSDPAFIVLEKSEAA
jgi:hypothetical protein